MASRKISIPNKHVRGFTLIEVLVVLGMFALVGGCSLVIGMESYRSGSLADDQASLVSALQEARSQAISAVCIGSACTAGMPHGVHITRKQLVIFQGAIYNVNDDTNDYIPLQDAALATSGLNDVVFAEYSGDANPPGDIVMSDGAERVATTSIGADGQIVW
ncbi:MAG: prepilin-type N-terminal cleavage/methylation domain-containing protein [Minisyncoccia bacterium]|jgi:prepilin-type N-terminal cleavage/methylation domain-containing protein